MSAARELFGLQEAFLARVNANPQAVRKRALWQQRGERYMRKVAFATDQRMVSADNTLNAAVLDLIETVFPTVADAFNRHMVPMARHAFDRWPTDTGVSKSMLALDFAIEGPERTQLRASFTSRAWYSMFIRRPVSPRPKRQRIKQGDVDARQAPSPPPSEAKKRKKRRGVIIVKELVWQPGENAADKMTTMIGDLLV